MSETYKISAQAYSDDHLVEITFDAAAFFEHASDAQLLALADCGWGGDYPADDVVYFFETGAHALPDVQYLMRYLHSQRGTRHAPGFECHVDETDAVAWLDEHRPRLAAVIAARA